jgi:hypothetical protein
MKVSGQLHAPIPLDPWEKPQTPIGAEATLPTDKLVSYHSTMQRHNPEDDLKFIGLGAFAARELDKVFSGYQPR